MVDGEPCCLFARLLSDLNVAPFRAAQTEHEVLITENGVEVLTIIE